MALSLFYRPLYRDENSGLYGSFDGAPFEMEIEIPSDSLGFAIPTVEGYGYQGEIDYGDGSGWQRFVGWDDAVFSHTYSVAGTYVVRIRGRFEAIDYFQTGSTPPDGEKLRETLGFGNTGLILFSFRGCALESVSGQIPNSVTELVNVWRDNNLTDWTIPIPNSVTDIRAAWRGNNITEWSTSIPDSVTDVTYAWFENNLTKWTAGGFEGIVDGTNAIGSILRTEDTGRILTDTDARNPNDNVTLNLGNSKYPPSAQYAINNRVARGWTISTGGVAAGVAAEYDMRVSESVIRDENDRVIEIKDQSGNGLHATTHYDQDPLLAPIYSASDPIANGFARIDNESYDLVDGVPKGFIIPDIPVSEFLIVLAWKDGIDDYFNHNYILTTNNGTSGNGGSGEVNQRLCGNRNGGDNIDAARICTPSKNLSPPSGNILPMPLCVLHGSFEQVPYIRYWLGANGGGGAGGERIWLGPCSYLKLYTEPLDTATRTAEVRQLMTEFNIS